MGTFYATPRDPNKGTNGLSYVLVSNYADVIGSVDASGYCTFTSGDGDPSTSFTKFVNTKETSGWDETPTGSAAQASVFYTQTLSLVFGRNDAQKRANLAQLGNSEVIVVCVPRSGEAVALGVDNGMDMLAGPSSSGKAPGDAASQTIELTANESYPRSYIDASTLSGIIPD